MQYISVTRLMHELVLPHVYQFMLYLEIGCSICGVDMHAQDAGTTWSNQAA